MAKLESLTDIENLESQTTATQALNSNSDKITEAFENTLSRDGAGPNSMGAAIDMDGHRILNLPAPQSGGDAARWQDVARALTLDGLAVPDIAGNAGKRLATDGLALFWATGGSGDLLSGNNLSDLASITTARNNLGLGTAATRNTGSAGSVVPLLNAAATFSGSVNFTASAGFSGAVSIPLAATIDGVPIGYREVPQRIIDNTYTFELGDSGKGISHTNPATHTWTIPPNSAVPFPIHTAIVLDNSGSGAVTVARGAGVTLRSNGSGTSGDKTLNQYFVHTLYKVGTDTWVWL